jgi:hypothetical protein
MIAAGRVGSTTHGDRTVILTNPDPGERIVGVLFCAWPPCAFHAE